MCTLSHNAFLGVETLQDSQDINDGSEAWCIRSLCAKQGWIGMWRGLQWPAQHIDAILVSCSARLLDDPSQFAKPVHQVHARIAQVDSEKGVGQGSPGSEGTVEYSVVTCALCCLSLTMRLQHVAAPSSILNQVLQEQ